ncbi:MAG: lycopene cyclase family protein [Chitinophagaceae bacterium]
MAFLFSPLRPNGKTLNIFKTSIILAQSFDYIILGAGCAGLSLAVRLVESGQFADKKILLCDKQPKNLNDRTWCFWEQEPGYFEGIVHHRYDKLWLKHPQGNLDLDIVPYSYKMIRGIDFYNHCFTILHKAPNVTVMYGEVSGIDTNAGIVSSGDEQYKAEHIFSSVLLQPPQLHTNQYYLLQHFRGWWVETSEDFFNPGEADMMNFNTSQEHGCTFVYVLPVSKRRALVEYTLFTEQELQPEQYDEGLKTFISQQLHLTDYTIHEVEHGVIPMTNIHFPQQEGKVVFIGTAGGQTKASTGYTFRFIQKQSDAIVAALAGSGKLVLPKTAARFMFYDSVLLRVLQEGKQSGADVFYRMFFKNKGRNVLRFLDNESSIGEELEIMNSTKKSVFVRAGITEFFKALFPR